MTWVDEMLVPLDACREAVTWARGYEDFASAWAACSRGDWLLWYAGRCVRQHGGDLHWRVVRAALACAREAWPMVREQDRAVVQACYDATQAWIDGTGDLATLRAAAADAVYAAADAAAAVYAVYAAAYAAYACLAYAVASAADAAAYACLAYAARVDTQQRTADLVREVFPVPPTREVVQ